MLRRIDRILLRVTRLDAAVRFYCDVLGLKLVRQDQRLASLRFPDDQAELVLHTDPDLPAEAVYYLVDDVRLLFSRRDELRLQFIQPPVATARGYRAVVKDPFGNVLLLVDRAGAQREHGAIEDGKPPGGLFPGVEEQTPMKRDALVAIYEQVARTADDLPYTPQFQQLYDQYLATLGGARPSRGEVWRQLLNLRKGGKLPKLGPARSQPPEVPEEAKQLLRDLLGKSMGRRDRLVYTERFDQIVDKLNQSLPRPLAANQVWRLLATLAK